MVVVVIGIVIGTFVLSLFLVNRLIQLASRLGLVDSPEGGEGRRIHDGERATSGGVAMWLAFTAGCLAFLAVGKADTFSPSGTSWIMALLASSGFIVLAGLIDDRWGLRPYQKLLCQVLTAFLFFGMRGTSAGSWLGFDVSLWLEVLIWVVWAVGLMNAFNLIDGMDGLCGGLAAISLSILGVILVVNRDWNGAAVVGISLATLAGFLRYNISPARIFLGDSGSMFLGFLIAVLGTASVGERATVTALVLPILIAGVPFVDVLLAVWRRAARKILNGSVNGTANSASEGTDGTAGTAGAGAGPSDSSQAAAHQSARIFGADREHLHHRLLALGLTQRRAAMILYGGAAFAAGLALLPAILDQRAIGLSLAIGLFAGLIGLRYLAPVELSITGDLARLSLKRPAPARRVAAFYWLYDVAVLIAVFFLAEWIEANGRVDWIRRDFLGASLVVSTASCIIALRLARASSRVWGRATLRDYWALAGWLGIGLIGAFSLNSFMEADFSWRFGRIVIMAGALGYVLLLVPRSIGGIARELHVDSIHRRLGRSRGERPRLLLYGAGDLGELVLAAIKQQDGRELSRYRLIGFIDDNPNLKGRALDGFKIFGGVDDLPYLHRRFGLHTVIVSSSQLSTENALRLSELTEQLGLRLVHWNPTIDLPEVEPVVE